MRALDDGFYSASTARDIASGGGAGNNPVLIEINALQAAVDAAARAGKLTIKIGVDQANATTFTDNTTGPIYREAFAGTEASFNSLFPTDNRQIFLLRMEKVIGYFTRIGYQVKREDQIGASPTVFDWIISW